MRSVKRRWLGLLLMSKFRNLVGVLEKRVHMPFL